MDFATARRNMVDGQIRTNKVTDPGLIEAFRIVPRELFVPTTERGRAYLDTDIGIGAGRYMMQPMVLARLLQAAQPDSGESALVAGAGTGYSAGILARLVASVVALEDNQALALAARAALAKIGADNVRVVEGAPRSGERGGAPYDIMLLDGAVAEPPRGLFEQLAEGGRLVGVLAQPGIGHGTLWRKNRAGVSARTLFDAHAPFVPGFAPQPGFVF